ncbi:Co-chaperone protein HscB [Buchnera aphidicola (Cinara pseudotaxifoliae)]|uniref:Co-chaperone protein HscB n=1 Tax=Buchnera aphidicola (Cinara pseudotaxifoliae) TaxID=655384 RepID=A0A451DI15_9GAMM|nr:Fe-S protein assembly co-chaperone HscB [Buchnera aphidicola]VFP86297.1 Co-chaperone protein HscB [Buchnera aphidicola (Cinara pseudotaxifoliae)]
MNYFNLFKLTQKFNIDKKKLTKNFYLLQKKHHPDITKEKKKRKMNQLSMSIKINQGFNILKKKFTRAKYLLDINKKKNIYLENNNLYQKKILIEQFKLNEKIQKIYKKLNAYSNINNFIKKEKIKLKLYFSQFNKAIEEKKIDYADQIFYRISFTRKIIKKAQYFKSKSINKKEIKL